MAKGSSSFKSHEDLAINPFQEACKIIAFAEESGRAGHEVFTVVVTNGELTWAFGKQSQDIPGFIAIIDRTKFAFGLTTRAWRILEERIAFEMYKQRKVW